MPFWFFYPELEQFKTYVNSNRSWRRELSKIWKRAVKNIRYHW